MAGADAMADAASQSNALFVQHLNLALTFLVENFRPAGSLRRSPLDSGHPAAGRPTAFFSPYSCRSKKPFWPARTSTGTPRAAANFRAVDVVTC